MFDYKKKKQVESIFSDFRFEIVNSVEALKRAVLIAIDSKNIGLDEAINMVRISESKADALRAEIEVILYGKSLFPESRGDIFSLLETTDRIANQAETCALMLKTHQIIIPDFCVTSILSIINYGLNITRTLSEAEEKIFKNYRLALPLVGKISQIESDADDIEIFLIEEIFKSDIDPFKKIVLRDWTSNLSHICDRAEDVSDLIRVIVAKRGV